MSRAEGTPWGVAGRGGAGRHGHVVELRHIPCQSHDAYGCLRLPMAAYGLLLACRCSRGAGEPTSLHFRCLQLTHGRVCNYINLGWAGLGSPTRLRHRFAIHTRLYYFFDTFLLQKKPQKYNEQKEPEDEFILLHLTMPNGLLRGVRSSSALIFEKRNYISI